MAYVIKNDLGQYLRLYPHRYSKKREWVDELDQASTWEALGSAKLASRHADKPTEIQEVRLILWGSPIPHVPKRLR